ncbi:MAG TPA: hypothetical protein VJ732_04610, partial [Bryobacteraceae bacterium]|nr:hypothetical protein [Bryobacteraceae bacterium]
MQAVKKRTTRRWMLWALLGPAWYLRAAEGNDVAIVVRQDVPVDNLSFAELRRLMLGDRQYWNSSLRVTLLVRAPGAREREVVLKTIYQMSEAQFRQYWI